MCRSIRVLRGTGATDEEIREAALQFVRKVSGFRQPARVNAEAFDAAVEDVAAASRRLLDSLVVRPSRGGDERVPAPERGAVRARSREGAGKTAS